MFAFDPRTDAFDPFAPGVMDDPYPYYDVLREHDPVHHNARLGMYFLSRFDDVRQADRDRARFRRGQLSRYYGTYAAAARMIVGNSLFTKDPPDHTRLKLLFSRAFSRSRIEAMRPRIEELCVEVLDSIDLSADGGTLRLVHDFSYPFPSLVICDLLGIPPADRTLFRGWSDDLVPLIDPLVTPERRSRGEAACTALAAYLTDLSASTRRALESGECPPGLLTALIEVAEEGERLSGDELIMLCSVLVIAGFETTTLSIAHAMRALVDNPEQLTALRTEPGLHAALPDEVLRYYSTAQYSPRESAADVEIAGKTVPAGSRVMLLRGAANRDERQFANANRFDLRRPNNTEHLGFGEGATFCTGAGLARIELEVAARMLLDRITPTGIARWVQRPSTLLWGPSEVHLEYTIPA